MAELPPEARVVYDLVHDELEDLFDRKMADFSDKMAKSINSKFAAVTDQISELRDEISFGDGSPVKEAGGVDAGSPLVPAHKSAALGSSSRQAVPPAPTFGVAAAAANTGPDGHCVDKLHRGKDYVEIGRAHV